MFLFGNFIKKVWYHDFHSWTALEFLLNYHRNLSKNAQCGNFMDFVSFRFYVESILRIKSAKSAILLHLEALNFDFFFMNFCTFWRLKFTKWTKFTAPKMAKTTAFALLESSKLISRKLSVRKAQKGSCDHWALFLYTSHFVPWFI